MSTSSHGRGYVKVYRSLQDHWMGSRSPACEKWAWIDFIMLAAWEPHFVEIKGEPVLVDRGDVVASVRFLMTRWRWGSSKTQRFLWELASRKLVVKKRHGSQHTDPTVFSVTNYDLYQSQPDEVSTGVSTPVGTRAARERHETKKGKKVKKESTALSALPAPDAEAVLSATPEQPAKGEEWGAPDALVALYHDLIPSGHPRVTLPLSPARVAKAKDYLKRFPAREFWVQSFGMVRLVKFLREGSAERPNFRGDFDWFLQRGKDGTENALKAFEGKYLDKKSAEPDYPLTWGPCTACGKFHKTTAALKGVCQKAAEEAAEAMRLAARAKVIPIHPLKEPA